MKKFTLVLVLFSLWVSITFSQTDNKPSYLLNTKKFSVELAVGPSFPYGDYGRKSASNESSGYAKLGYKIEAGASYKLIDVINISIMGFYNANGTDLSDFESHLAYIYPGTSWSAQSGRWDIFGGLLGFSLSFPLTKKLTGNFRAYSGILNATLPALEVLGNSGNKYNQDEKTTTSFTYIVSLSVTYPLSKWLYWSSSVDFLGATPNFSDVNTKTVVGGITKTGITNFSQNMQSFIIDTGLMIVF
jgi:hypothetical protein